MNKYFKLILSMPLIGVIIPYLYYFITITAIKLNPEKYGCLRDPHYSIIGFVFDFLVYPILISWFCMIIGFFLFFSKLVEIKFKLIYIVGTILTIYSHHFDPNGIIFRFAD